MAAFVFLFFASGSSKLDRLLRTKKPAANAAGAMMKTCGEGGIRTLGTVARTTVFETATIDRSATSPGILSRLKSGEKPGGKNSKIYGRN
jgi:hypothetical protein